jgi:hypothetical protein
MSFLTTVSLKGSGKIENETKISTGTWEFENSVGYLHLIMNKYKEEHYIKNKYNRK